MSDPKADRIGDYLAHILDAIGRIESYVAGLDQDAFTRTSLVQDAVIRNFEIIGESASKIAQADPGFGRRHANLRLDLAYRMRNVLIHGYDAVNLVTLWNTIQTDLPVLKKQVTVLLEPSRNRATYSVTRHLPLRIARLQARPLRQGLDVGNRRVEADRI